MDGRVQIWFKILPAMWLGAAEKNATLQKNTTPGKSASSIARHFSESVQPCFLQPSCADPAADTRIPAQ